MEHIAGLESVWPGMSELKLNDDCKDYTWQIWRFFTYQFSHAGLSHIGFNSFMLVFLGVPLEGFHGTLHILFMFNVGVFGGACCHLLADAHGPSLVGMSGGCYALLGMHMADIVLNFAEKERPRRKLAVLLLIIVIDLVNIVLTSSKDVDSSPSHWAHLGGWVYGLIIGIVVGRNIVKKAWERYMWLAGFTSGLGLTVFAVAWCLSWPPADLIEQVRWCWTRQIYNMSIFGDDQYHCVRCATDACITRWVSQEFQAPVAASTCSSHGGWAISE